MSSEGRNQSDDDEQFEEEENPLLPADDEEQNPFQIRIRNQSRSFFTNVRRKYNGETFQPWSAEIRRPKEIGGATIMLKTYATDVEAAVVASVVARLFELVAQPIRDQNYANRSRPPRIAKVDLNKPIGCYNYLIDRNIARGVLLPDCRNNDAIRDFVQPCHEDFLRIAKDVENNIIPMPNNKSIAEAIELYLYKAIPFDKEYPENQVPPEKQARPFTNKRRHRTAPRGRRGYVELDCKCDHHPRRKILKWEVDTDLCLCTGVHFRLVPAEGAGSGPYPGIHHPAYGVYPTDPGTSQAAQGAHPADPGNSHPAYGAHPADPNTFHAVDGGQLADPGISHPAADGTPVDPGASHPDGAHPADPDTSQAIDGVDPRV